MSCLLRLLSFSLGVSAMVNHGLGQHDVSMSIMHIAPGLKFSIDILILIILNESTPMMTISVRLL